MKKNDNLVIDKDNRKASINETIIQLASICFPIIYIIIDFIQSRKVYNNWQNRYIMIYEAGDEVKRNSSALSIVFFIVYILLIIVLKDKKKKKHIIFMLIALFILNYLFGILNSWA